MIRDLTELNKLESYLKAHGYEYTREDEVYLPREIEFTTVPGEWFRGAPKPIDTHQIIAYENGRRSWDVVCHAGSYGCSLGLLEGMGDIFGFDVMGWLTADDVIQRIERTKK